LVFLKKFFSRRTPSELEQKIGYLFRKSKLLDTALTHRSYGSSGNDSYERLEFLGDAVLELVISEYLFIKYRTKPEGELTNLRSLLVNSKILSQVALSLDIQKYLKTDKGLNLDSPATRQNLLSSSLEAIIGAIYLDGGIQPTKKFILQALVSPQKKDIELTHYNYKGQLIEYCQKRGIGRPVFQIEKIEGPDHAPHYTIAVYIRQELTGQGQGSSKLIAEQQAAEIAFKNLHKKG
jgi:ribonuclease-3